MALVLADRVNETTTTAGTGTLTLAGAVSGYQSFSAIGNANTTYYTIVGQTTGEWEVGLGTYTSSGTTLSRDTVLASSAGGTTKVTLSAGTKFVFCDYPAGKAAYLDASNNLTLTNALGATYGGTGQTVYAVGDLLYASTTTALSKLADVATGSAVISGGVGVAPSYGKIGLTTHVSGTLPVANGGTGQTTYTDGQLLIGNTTGNTLTKTTLTAGSGITVTNGSGTITIASTAGGGSVTSVGMTVPTFLSVTGSPVTTSGTLAVSLSGTALPVANGGTGQTTYTDGQLLIGNSTGNTLAKTTLTAGSNVTITNGAGTITIAASGGGSSTYTISNKTAAYTVIAGDLATVINCTSGTFTVSLTAAATLGSGFNCWIWNTSATTGDTITIDPSGAETIDGVATLILRRGEGTQIVCNGTNWETGAKKTMRAYAENYPSNITRPIATGSASVSIGDSSSATGNFSAAMGLSATASARSGLALGRSVTAAALYSTAIGTGSSEANGAQTTSGSGAMALGASYASGTDSFAAANANNTSTYGAQGTGSIAIGQSAKATGATGSTAVGYNAVASGTGSVALGGGTSASPVASGTSSIAIGGYVLGAPTASSTYAIAIGDGTLANNGYTLAVGQESQATISGGMVFGRQALSGATQGKYAQANGAFAAVGDAQYGNTILKRATTDATASALTADAAAPATGTQLTLPNNTAMAFTGTVIARQQAAGGTASAAWKVEGLIRREGTAASTTLVASTVTAISNVPAWTLALSADTTRGALAVTATGAAATNIRWVATIQTSEVTYA